MPSKFGPHVPLSPLSREDNEMPPTQNVDHATLSASTPPASGEVVAVIDADEFAEAQRDPRLAKFAADAEAYMAELERDGRNR